MIASIADTQYPDPADYGIDVETGFVAFDNSSLPAYYNPWETIIASLPELLRSKQIEIHVKSLPVLTTSSLTTDSHWRRAYVVLGYLTQAYIWEDNNHPRDIVPVCLGAPFLDVCDHLRMKPVLSYAGLCLWNCAIRSEEIAISLSSSTTDGTDQFLSSKNEILSDFSQIKCYASFTGTRDEDAFNLVPVMVEFHGAKLVPLLLSCIQAQSQSDLTAKLLTTLPMVTSTLKSMIALLPLLNSTCQPQLFYHDLRPFLSGSTSLPNGIQYTHSDTSKTQVSCIGGSAAQSPLFQFLDHMLGIVHSSPSSSPRTTHPLLLQMREYMPQTHRTFLEAVDSLPSIPDVISTHHHSNPQQQDQDQDQAQEQIQSLLQESIATLREWRNKHINLVARYIIAPAREAKKEEGGKEDNEPKGTAGSSPMVFLKAVRDETLLVRD